MSATANPNFALQQQALGSLKNIHQICLILEAIQAAGSVLMLCLGYWVRPLHLYGSMLYLFSAVFAHIVVYQVLNSISRNIREAHYASPNRHQEWLVFATARISGKIFPYILVHAIVLFSLVAMATVGGLSGRAIPHHAAAAWTAAVVGWVCLGRVWFALRENTEYLTVFVRGGGFISTEAVIEQ